MSFRNRYLFIFIHSRVPRPQGGHGNFDEIGEKSPFSRGHQIFQPDSNPFFRRMAVRAGLKQGNRGWSCIIPVKINERGENWLNNIMIF
jgi:hypothetical protein